MCSLQVGVAKFKNGIKHNLAFLILGSMISALSVYVAPEDAK